MPYHGGPGSNYSTHGICGIVEKLRTDLFRGRLGLVGANGGILTEHAVGIYSTLPPARPYTRRPVGEYTDTNDYHLDMDQYAFAPQGIGRILTWTVEYSRKPNVPETGIMIGEVVGGPDDGKRFCANTAAGDATSLAWLLETCRIGETVAISSEERKKGKPASARVTFARRGAPGKSKI